MAGVEPWPYSFWELRTIAEARQRSEWDRAAAIIAMVHNTQAKPEHQKPASRWNPYKPPPRVLSKEETGTALVDAFFPNRKSTVES